MLSAAAAWQAMAAPRRSPTVAWTLLVLLVLALQFGPFVGLLGFRLGDDPRWALTGALRDLAVAALVLCATQALLAAGQRRSLPRSALWALAMTTVYALLALLAGSDLLVLALNLRRLALVPLLFLALVVIPWTPTQVDRLFALVVGSCVCVALFGLVERLAPETLWTDWLEIERFTAANGLDRFGAIAYQDSGRFFSWDLESWTGAPWRRMVSTYLEPTTLAAAMAVLLVVARARHARGHGAWLLSVLALVCGLATLSKGFVLFLLLALAWRRLGIPSPRQLLLLSGLACAAAAAGAALQLEGPLEHVAGLSSALHYLGEGNLLGQGIGNAGNYTEAEIDFGEESGLGNAIGQVGLAALLPLFWVAAIARDVLVAAAARSDPGGAWLAAWLLFWTVSYLFSASSLGVGGNALGFALLGLYLNPASGALAR